MRYPCREPEVSVKLTPRSCMRAFPPRLIGLTPYNGDTTCMSNPAGLRRISYTMLASAMLPPSYSRTSPQWELVYLGKETCQSGGGTRTPLESQLLILLFNVAVEHLLYVYALRSRNISFSLHRTSQVLYCIKNGCPEHHAVPFTSRCCLVWLVAHLRLFSRSYQSLTDNVPSHWLLLGHRTSFGPIHCQNLESGRGNRAQSSRSVVHSHQ